MILDKINSPKELKNIKLKDLPLLAQEIRNTMINVISKNGGHLGSSLGTVELSIALHYVYDTPKDKIIWDVGHQAYAHKILTGRKNKFETIRCFGGLSGFLRRDESPYDAYISGHASTSISAALGICAGQVLQDDQSKVIAVIGDGSMTGGLAYEGLNNLKSNPKSAKNLLIVLNDNGMSISQNVGGLSSYLSKKFSGPLYTRVKKELRNVFSDNTIKILKKIKQIVKTILMPAEFFESLGLRYIGPIDGHNIETLVHVLNNLKKTDQELPVLLHLRTQKGKGYKFAETQPEIYHGVPRFDTETGISTCLKSDQSSFTDVFGKALCDIAENNNKVVAITAAMMSGTGLNDFAEKFPTRFFDVGIAEGHAVTFAAGLATQGVTPVVAVYSSFIQRAYDQIIHDVCLQNLPVVFCIDRAGIVGEDGPTHHGAFDLSFLRAIPNLIIMAPSTGDELRDMLYSAINYKKPVVIRYPRATAFQKNTISQPFNIIPLGQPREILKFKMQKNNGRILLLNCGPFSVVCEELTKELATLGFATEALDIRFIKPISQKVLDAVRNSDFVFTIEENTTSGGFGSALMEQVSKTDKPSLSKIQVFGLEDKFITHGSRSELLMKTGLNFESLLLNISMQVKSKIVSPDKFKNIPPYNPQTVMYENKRTH